MVLIPSSDCSIDAVLHPNTFNTVWSGVKTTRTCNGFEIHLTLWQDSYNKKHDFEQELCKLPNVVIYYTHRFTL